MKKSMKNQIGFWFCVAAFFFIIQFDPDVKKSTIITDAIRNGDADTIESILKSERPIDEGKHLDIPYLLEAIDNNRTDIVKLYIKYGADINVTGFREKSTPLGVAAYRGYEEIAKFLIDNGAKINIKNRVEKTPLMCAVQNGHYNIAKLLIQNGADINAKRCKYGSENVLTFAVQSLESEIVKLLVENKVRYDRKYISDLKEKREDMESHYHGNKSFYEEFEKIILYLKRNLETGAGQSSETMSELGFRGLKGLPEFPIRISAFCLKIPLNPPLKKGENVRTEDFLNTL